MILYLIKSTLCLLLLIGVYQVLLARAGTFHFNRFFLLFAIGFSLTIPLVELDTWKANMSEEAPVMSVLTEVEQQLVSFESPEIYVTASEASANAPKSMIPILMFLIYGLVLLILFSRYVFNIMKLLKRNRNAKAVYYEGIKMYLLNDNIAPHSFLNHIFIGKDDYQKGVSPKLLIHELAHVQQGHTYDILFVELVSIVFWFNPVLRLYSKAIRVNHEYLADRAVIKRHQDIGDYQLQLIQYISKFRSPAFTSHLNYSFTKKRFEMMKKKISKTSATITIAVLIPILFLALMAFSPAVKKIERSLEAGVPSIGTLISLEVFEAENRIPSILPIDKSALHRVSSGFGERIDPITKEKRWHLGLDFTAETGVNVLATADGTITFADYNSGYGNHIKIDHGEGYVTLYAHMHELKVSAGESVKIGDVIGSVGSSGKSDKPHLHYEVIKDGKRVNPENFIPGMSKTKVGQQQPGSVGTWSRYTIGDKTYRLNNIKRIFIGSEDDAIRQIMLNDSIAVVIYRDLKTIVKGLDEFTEEEKTMLNAPPQKTNRVSPTQKQLDDWLDPTKYGVWLDGKRIPNEELKSYEPEDFSRVFVSGLEKNAKNYGKHEFQVNIQTNEAFEKSWQEKLKAWERQRKF